MPRGRQNWELVGFLRNANLNLPIDEFKAVFYAMQTDFWADERALRAIMETFAKRIKNANTYFNNQTRCAMMGNNLGEMK